MDIRKAIADTGAVLEGEFFFALKKRGRVSTKYINLDPVFTHPQLVGKIGRELIAPWQGQFSVMAAPAVGAIPFLYGGTLWLGESVRTVWADKKIDGTFAFERMGFAQAVHHKRVLVIEDIVSTGSSAKAICDLVQQAGGTVVGAAFVWNRGSLKAAELGVLALYSLIDESVPTWEAGDHEKWGVWPLVEDIAHPEYFPDYPGPRIKLQRRM